MIEYRDGIHLKGTGLWFDSKKKTELSFISSADIDKFTAPEKIITTPETIKLLGYKVRKAVLLTCPYDRPFTLGNLQVELIPSGHMLGSAQMVVDKGEKTLIYAGDISHGKLPTAKPLSVRSCNVLVLKCPHGPDSELPTMAESLELLMKFIQEALSLNATPLLTLNAFGIGQDIIKSLGDNGYKLSLHPSIHQITKVYESFGISFGDYELLKPANVYDRVVITSYEHSNTDDIKKIKAKRKAIITEWGKEKEHKEEEHHDQSICETFTFSSKAGFDELMQYVEKVNPSKIYLIDRYANEFAKKLKSKGYEAVVLEKPTQLDLL